VTRKPASDSPGGEARRLQAVELRRRVRVREGVDLGRRQPGTFCRRAHLLGGYEGDAGFEGDTGLPTGFLGQPQVGDEAEEEEATSSEDVSELAADHHERRHD
jgi:hypothetical protein